MAKARAPWTEEIYRLLWAHGAMKLDDLMRETSKVVPPARAAEYHRRRLTNKRRRYKYQGKRSPRDGSVAARVRSGQYALARESFDIQVRRGHIVRFKKGNVDYVRLLNDEERAARLAALKESHHQAVVRGWKTRKAKDPQAGTKAVRKAWKTRRAA